nr:calcium-binding protein [Leptolyngbya sp. FACHB-711]
MTGNDETWRLGGNDSLIGGSGDDTLTEGNGTNTMTGGAGSDRFRFYTGTAFNRESNGIDRITDFIPSVDKIVLDKNTFRSLSSSLGNGFSVPSEFAIVNNSASAATQSAKIVYVNTAGVLIFNRNGSAPGFGSGGWFAVLNGNPALTANDFQITPFSSVIFG